MKTIYCIIFISTLAFGQDRLSFIKNEELKKEVKKSIEYLHKTKFIPSKIRDKVIFVTFDFDKMFNEEQTETIGINYSTYLPMRYSKLNLKGKFTTDPQNKVLYFNYSKNIVLIFFKGEEYFEIEKMEKLSSEFEISRETLMKSEFFKYEKGNEVTLDNVKNFISLEKKNGKFMPIRVNSFDLRAFVEVWYELENIKEIPISERK